MEVFEKKPYPGGYFFFLAALLRLVEVFFLAEDFLAEAGLPDTPVGSDSSGMSLIAGFALFLDLNTEIQKSCDAKATMSVVTMTKSGSATKPMTTPRKAIRATIEIKTRIYQMGKKS